VDKNDIFFHDHISSGDLGAKYLFYGKWKKMTYSIEDSASFALKYLLPRDSLRRFKSLKTEEERLSFYTA